MKVSVAIALLFLLAANNLFSSPESDLSSTSQQTRDTAAKVLRTTYIAPSRTRWDTFVSTIKTGDTKSNVIERLRSVDAGTMPEWGDATGGSCYETYRLDDLWMLSCAFRCHNNTLVKCHLTERLRSVWVKPPPKFTGVWITYFVNGQKSHEVRYNDGSYFGEFIAYHPNGQKSYVQHYDERGANGADTGWHDNGAKMYEAQYRNGKQDGRWIWWYRDGKKQSEINWNNGTFDGLNAGWYENGQMRFEMNFKTGVQNGVEAAWDEKGNLQYKREQKDGNVVE